jgi:SAM-dependent methyltransferase
VPTKLRRIARDWLPPAVIRLLRAVPTPGAEGKERGPAFYDRSFLAHEHWSAHYTQSRYYFLWAVIADRLRAREAACVLDLGCGPGQLASLLHDTGIPAYVGIDFSPRRIEQARLVCPDYTFVEADVFATDLLETLDYDTVLATEFLEHIEQDHDVLRRLRAGSHFIGTVPNFPASGHVRHFEGAAQVSARYAAAFRQLAVTPFRASAEGKVYFLLDGVLA